MKPLKPIVPIIFTLTLVLFISVVSAQTITPISTFNGITQNASIALSYNLTTNSGLNNLNWSWNNVNYSLYDNSLILWYGFNNLSSLGENDTYVVDLTGRGYNATVLNMTWVSGYGRGNTGGFTFGENTSAGVPKYISGTQVLTNTSNFTISVWINPSNNSYADAVYVTRFLGNYNLLRWYGSSQKCFASFYNGSDVDTESNRLVREYYVSHAGNCLAGKWHNMIFTYNTLNNNISFYVDGKIYARGTFLNAIAGNPATPLLIGAARTEYPQLNYLSLNGSLDDYMIWNRTLSQDEATQIYAMQFNKYNPSNYSLVMNESTNILSLNLTHLSDSFNYSLCFTDGVGSACSSRNTFSTRLVNSKIISLWSNPIGQVRSDFYGVGLQSAKMVTGSIDTNCDGVAETPRDLVADRADFLNGGNKITYYDASLGSYYFVNVNYGFEKWFINNNNSTIGNSVSYTNISYNWNIYSFNNQTGYASITNDSHSGQSALQLNSTVNGTTNAVLGFKTTAYLIPGHTYNASLWVKGNTTGAQNNIVSFYFFKTISSTSLAISPNSSWQFYSTTFTPNASQGGVWDIKLERGGTWNIVVDDFSLTDNGVFENMWMSGNMSGAQQQADWDYQNNVTSMFIMDYMIDSLANKNVSNCVTSLSDTDTNDCSPLDYGMWQNLTIDYYRQVDQGRNRTYVEVWNEPYNGFFEDRLTDNSAKTDFVLLYNATYDAIKAYNSSIKVVGYRDTSLDRFANYMTDFTKMMMSNLSNKLTEGFSFHPYYGSGYINGVNKIEVALMNIFNNLTAYGGGTNYIIVDEWQPNYVFRNESNANSPRYSAEIAYFYSSILNSYPANVSSMYYHWDDTVSYFKCSSRYPEYPSFWEGISEAGLDNPTRTYYPPYTVTANFSKYAKANGWTYTTLSNDSSDGVISNDGVEVLSAKGGNVYNQIIVNSVNGFRNATLDIGEANLLMNTLGGTLYTNGSTLLLDNYSVVYLTTPNLTLQEGTGLIKDNYLGERIGVGNEIWFSSSNANEKHIASNLSIPVTIPVVITNLNCKGMSKMTYTPNGADTITYYGNDAYEACKTLETGYLATINPSVESNVFTFEFDCSTSTVAGYSLIMIAGSLMLVVFFIVRIYNKGGLAEITLGDIVILFVAIALGVVFWTVAGQNLGSTCHVG